MLRIALSLAAAAAILTGAAAARTVVIADVLAQNGGMNGGNVIDLGDVAIRFYAPGVAFAQERSLAAGDQFNWAQTKAKSSSARTPFYVEIVLKSAAKISAFNFSNRASGSILANGKSYRFAEVGNLALKAPVIVIRSWTDKKLALESFEITETPLPGAGFLMMAGLAGIGFAMSRRKKV